MTEPSLELAPGNPGIYPSNGAGHFFIGAHMADHSKPQSATPVGTRDMQPQTTEDAPPPSVLPERWYHSFPNVVAAIALGLFGPVLAVVILINCHDQVVVHESLIALTSSLTTAFGIVLGQRLTAKRQHGPAPGSE